MKRVILFGSSGRTGQILAQVAQGAGYDLLCPSHAELPLENTRALQEYLLAHPAAAVINAAAISGLEDCARDVVLTHRINAMAPACMAQICRHTGSRFIHLSTDYVLDGRRVGLKNESTKCRPASIYAQSKREGEESVLEANSASLILRVSWICGNPALPGFIEQSCAKALAGQELAAIDDKFSLPTHARDIARVCLALIERKDCQGIAHLCSQGEPLSWYQCAYLALQALQEQGALKHCPLIEVQKLAQVPFFQEERPRHTAMRCERLEQWGLAEILPTAEQCVSAAVADYLAAKPRNSS